LNKNKIYFKIKFWRSLTYLNLDRIVVTIIRIGLLPKKRLKVSFRDVYSLRLIEISISSQVVAMRSRSQPHSFDSFFLPRTRYFDECRAVEMCWKSRETFSECSIFKRNISILVGTSLFGILTLQSLGNKVSKCTQFSTCLIEKWFSRYFDMLQHYECMCWARQSRLNWKQCNSIYFTFRVKLTYSTLLYFLQRKIKIQCQPYS
jgi:hypothetical protein